MNNKRHLLATLVCSGAIFASVNVIADNATATDASDASSASQNSSESASPSSGTSTTASAAPESAASAFSRLDTTNRGYLVSDDVKGLQGFDANCDKDADGRIETEEFSPCWDQYVANSSASGSVGSTGTVEEGAPGADSGAQNQPQAGDPGPDGDPSTIGK
jgi:hypothetical protein